MQIVLKMLLNILIGICTEKLFRQLLAAGLEQVINHTDTTVDNALIEPVVKALRGSE
jgi:hypothetical protein